MPHPGKTNPSINFPLLWLLSYWKEVKFYSVWKDSGERRDKGHNNRKVSPLSSTIKIITVFETTIQSHSFSMVDVQDSGSIAGWAVAALLFWSV